MKNSNLILLLGFLVTGCKTYQTRQTINDFDNNVTFKVNKVMETYSLATGGGHWHPRRGNKFVILFIAFENNTAERKTLNFENVFLLDMANKTKYKIEFNLLKGPINMYDDSEASIGANKSKERKLVFTYPEDIKAEFISVNDKIVKIDYKN